MSGATISIKVHDEETQAMLRKLSKRMDDMTQVMKNIGSIVKASVTRNFEKGGRPAWKPLSKYTQARRKKKGEPLRLSDRLMKSISIQAGPKSVVVGTNVPYASVHQFGAKRGQFGTVPAKVKAHTRKNGQKVKAYSRNTPIPWGDIPARPFLMVQEENWEDIRAMVAVFLGR